jgi:hypothetical protein
MVRYRMAMTEVSMVRWISVSGAWMTLDRRIHARNMAAHLKVGAGTGSSLRSRRSMMKPPTAAAENRFKSGKRCRNSKYSWGRARMKIISAHMPGRANTQAGR